MKKQVFPQVVASLFILLLTTLAGAETRKLELVQDFKPVVQQGSLDLFIPAPLKDVDYQKTISQNITGNATSVKVEEVFLDSSKKTSVSVLHAHWDNAQDPVLKVDQIIETQDRAAEKTGSDDVSYFLKPTEHVQTDGIVAETAGKITKGMKTSDQKAQAIYDWVVENTFRDPKTRGCGLGDVKTLLMSGNFSGKCADLNSLFIGLARAAGVPAREVLGLRISPSQYAKSLGKEGDVSKSQHCRAEYYSAEQKAWVPVDPADIRKVILEEKLTLNDPEVKALRKKYFGNWEGNWIALNYGRDFKLPGQQKNLNFFMYPQLISKTASPDGTDPQEVKYSISSHLIR
jgi:transglutaminase-like putative cysteine protease